MKQSNLDLVRQIFGEDGPKKFAQIEAEDPEICHILEDFVTEKVWARPGLKLRDRSLITISSQVAMGRWDQVEIHMKSFLHMGGTPAELKEILIHLAVYCGFPAMISGLRILKETQS